MYSEIPRFQGESRSKLQQFLIKVSEKLPLSMKIAYVFSESILRLVLGPSWLQGLLSPHY